MKKTTLVAIVAVLLLGALVVLSRDDDPPLDQHLVLNEGAVPADGNGYLVLVELLEEMDWPSEDAWVGETLSSDLPDTEALLELVASNRGVLDRLSNVVAAEHFRAPNDGDPDTFEALKHVRQLGRLVGIDATIRMRAGDEDGALNSVLQYLELGHRLQTTGDLMPYLVGAACESDALGHLIELAGVSSGSGVEALLPHLRELGFDRDVMESALRREYVFLTATIDEPFDQGGGWVRAPGLGRYLYQPNRTRQLFADRFTEAIAGLDEDCATAVNEPARPELAKWRYLAPNSIGNILYLVAVPNFEGLTFSRCREQMRFGLTEIVLALHAYRAQEGQLPKGLGSLVPTYMDTLPVDVDGGGFRYVPSEGYVYSVGEDRIDQGGGEPDFSVDWSDPDPGVSLRPR